MTVKRKFIKKLSQPGLVLKKQLMQLKCLQKKIGSTLFKWFPPLPQLLYISSNSHILSPECIAALWDSCTPAWDITELPLSCL